MFLIVNTSKQSISISDLKLILGPRQGIDLDVKYSREQVGKSKGLKSLISKGLISIKNKTEAVVESRFIQEVHNHNNEFDAEKMKADIMNGLKEAIAENMTAQPQLTPQTQPNIDMAELAKMIASMIPQTQQNIPISKDKEIKVDADVMSDMHSRVVDKIVKDVGSSNIVLKGETKKSDIDDNIGELEDMLG